ncbi:putative ferric-chelate reductase 1 [Megalops cyprinoides]|uniref:putative ferric-chelate reductase 1 n=1 Tax=Megalops cyprinoides TaxID=118141 RepID=UPI0018655973|nr:putative ferric-chelate reductase 1 [Megalops cyprinoides]
MYTCILLIIACVVRMVECYSSGQVTASCGSMTPQHSGGTTQTSASPYSVTASQSTYKAGDTITVTLQGGSTAFAGFLLQAREVGGSSPVGSFTVSTGQAQLLTCSGLLNSAVSHTSDASKTQIQALWKAPSSGTLKDIEFRATFVKVFSTFWVQVKSSAVTYSGAQSSGNTPVSSTTAAPSNPSTGGISSTGCGNSKVCFSKPNSCDPSTTTNCYFMSALTSSTDSSTKFEIAGPSSGYVAIGFSDDQRMGNDDIYICGLDSNGNIQVQHAYSTGRYAPEILPPGNISVTENSFQNGIIRCSFTSGNAITTQRSATSSPVYYIMYAYGPSSNGDILEHTGTFISDSKVDLSSPLSVNTKVPDIVRAHGALMLIAWMTTGSLGMLIARYLKSVTRGVGCCGKDLWFVAHVFLMAITVIATSIAFILIFSYARDWSGGAHPVLGCIVMILALVQPIAAAFRCGPDHTWRFIFNWAHTLNAVAIKCLAVAAIFTGLSFIDNTPDMWIQKVMGGFVAWEALLFALQDLQFRCNQKDVRETNPNSMNVEVTLLIVFLLGNLAFLVAILAGIGTS